MQLKWSHAVLNVKDVDKELALYTGVPEFTIIDRGPVGKNAPELVFMSQDKS
jgi:catechol 2,3-dioxygenase-like lactoylglutathione lyase family enzyme